MRCKDRRDKGCKIKGCVASHPNPRSKRTNNDTGIIRKYNTGIIRKYNTGIILVILYYSISTENTDSII
jgi:hypothetical protein